MRKRPEIPEDVFFDNSSRDEEPQEAEAVADEPQSPVEPVSRGKVREPRSDTKVVRKPAAVETRVGRPPAQEGPKVPVTLYLTEPVAHMLEEIRFLLLTEHGVRTSKSAIADFALRHGLDDLEAVADDLRRE